MMNMNMLRLLQQLKRDPVRLLSSKYNVPQGLTTSNEIIQHLLNTGQISQSQVNGIMRMRNNPMVNQMINQMSNME